MIDTDGYFEEYVDIKFDKTLEPHEIENIQKNLKSKLYDRDIKLYTEIVITNTSDYLQGLNTLTVLFGGITGNYIDKSIEQAGSRQAFFNNAVSEVCHEISESFEGDNTYFEQDEFGNSIFTTKFSLANSLG